MGLGGVDVPADVGKDDLRSKRTEKALNDAMSALLGRRNFRKITVSDICEESLISRATFYSHFPDKYSFLKWWMMTVWPESLVNKEDTYEVKEQKVNEFISKNKAIIKNVLKDADSWTIDVVFDVLHKILHVTTEKSIDGLPNPKYIVQSNFYLGGVIYYILWQVENDFPQDVTFMNAHVFEAIRLFHEWN